jgi:hypothetical protein
MVLFGAENGVMVAAKMGMRKEWTCVMIYHWLLTSGKFDHVVDFAAAVEDPDQPDRLAPAYNSGDFLHLNPAGYRRMAEVFDLGVFERCSPTRPRHARI